jgi:hypothetical protein
LRISLLMYHPNSFSAARSRRGEKKGFGRHTGKGGTQGSFPTSVFNPECEGSLESLAPSLGNEGDQPVGVLEEKSQARMRCRRP